MVNYSPFIVSGMYHERYHAKYLQESEMPGDACSKGCELVRCGGQRVKASSEILDAVLPEAE